MDSIFSFRTLKTPFHFSASHSFWPEVCCNLSFVPVHVCVYLSRGFKIFSLSLVFSDWDVFGVSVFMFLLLGFYWPFWICGFTINWGRGLGIGHLFPQIFCLPFFSSPLRLQLHVCKSPFCTSHWCSVHFLLPASSVLALFWVIFFDRWFFFCSVGSDDKTLISDTSFFISGSFL